MKKILFLSSITGHAGNSLRLGFFDFINNGHDCEISLINNARELTLAQAKELSAAHFDGILIGSEKTTPAIEELLSTKIPKILMLVDCRSKKTKDESIFIVKNDDITVGATAAKHLMSRGNFKSYAFIHPERETPWSKDRFTGFSKVLSAAGLNISCTHSKAPDLVDFLLSLPKPIGVFCAADTIAINMIAACRKTTLKIPVQVAIVGVDDDETLCESIRPTLSSVHTSDREVGRLATEVLFQVMRGKKPLQKTTHVLPGEVAERYSSHGISTSGYLIREGLDYIHKNFHTGISANDVIRHLGVSPTLARTRFKKIHGKSIRDEILDTRFEVAMRMLKSGKKTIAQIASECGFHSIQRMSHFFQERLGKSPSSFKPRQSISPRQENSERHGISSSSVQFSRSPSPPPSAAHFACRPQQKSQLRNPPRWSRI